MNKDRRTYVLTEREAQRIQYKVNEANIEERMLEVSMNVEK